MKLKREPALIYSCLASIVSALVLLFTGHQIDLEPWRPIALVLIPIIAGLFTRQKVMPTATIKEAGLSPTAVKQRAEDPDVVPHEGA